MPALTSYQPTRTTKELRSFLGFASFFRRFIANFARRTRPLTELLKNSTTCTWSNEQQHAFEDIKQAPLQPPTLAHINDTAESFIHTDASAAGLGDALLQADSMGAKHVLAYASKHLLGAEALRHSL